MHTRILKNQSRRTFLTSMTQEPLCCWVLALLLVLTGALREGRAQTNSPSHRSNRYLLVVETSHSMQKRVDGVLQSVQDLLVSNVGGQLKNGDTVGIWTYSEELSTGQLPVQQ